MAGTKLGIFSFNFELLGGFLGAVVGGGVTPPGKVLGPFYPPPNLCSHFTALPLCFGGSKAHVKICACTFETCRSSDLYHYMIFYIILGHRGNKMKNVLDIDN
jgi:hypothetical protein